MKTIVISGINLYEGGPLSVYYDCLDTICEKKIFENNHIIALVHKASLFKKYENHIELMEFPKSRKSYLFRLYYEYFYFNKLFKEVDIWFSLHDITPRVHAKTIYTYCHNPAPFMEKDLKNVKYSIKNVMFAFLYKYLYRINIKSATAIIVQQDWIRKEFIKMFPVNNVIVARPNIKISKDYEIKNNKKSNQFIFFYPAFPRYFKNFEVICEACARLEEENIEVWLTIDGSENAYSKNLKKKYGYLKNIQWLGLQPRKRIFEIYNQVDSLIFPSTLETWGLPISEFKLTGKPMILADKPYAKETLGEYDKAVFFDPYDVLRLEKLMQKVARGSIQFKYYSEKKVSQPYANDWAELLHMIL